MPLEDFSLTLAWTSQQSFAKSSNKSEYLVNR